ncbi:AAA family ATPase [Streptomyces neyagawaensis]|uniref:AAA family ATPase n=1 Tax=Streptomyces neyagawaensis TaxID=42238 RepID=UPI0006E4303C|nr:AAA family ATPase [Streptomyces neyagawaensis]MCL6734426.1 ATP-binding protein [Streptomyces neyagawaensis]MDE1682055.1 AAA family ATPase [Streptomyces neyagawaensis]
MTTFTFAPATRETARARIGLQGPAGSGKTKTALRLAEGLAQGGPIGLADTERGSALKYAPVPGRPDLGGHTFGHLPMDRHDPRDLIKVVRAAEEAKLAVLIVDSWSHFWNGRGGLLEIVEEAGSQKGAGGTFGGWRTGNPIEQEMLDALLNFQGHLIVTMRTKGDYVIEGKRVTKVGVKAVQREGAEYELDVVMDMVEGTATVTKTRYEPLNGQVIHHPGEDVAELILEQLGQGVDPVQAIVDELVRDGLTYDRALQLHRQAEARRLLGADLLHPKTGAPGKLGELIKEYGQAVKPVTTGVTSPPPSSATTTGQGDDSRPEGETRAAPLNPPADAGQDQGPTPVTAPQMRMMHACFSKVGLGHKDSRPYRLRATSLIIGREIGSANELTKDEAQTLLDTLTNFGERGETAASDFAAMVDGLAKQPA